MTLMLAFLLFLETLDPYAPQQAYLTDDPINPDRLGLATPDGRFALRLIEGCDGFASGQNVLIWPSLNLPPWLTLGPTTWDATTGVPSCIARIEGRMDTTPCFVNDVGQCDVALEGL